MFSWGLRGKKYLASNCRDSGNNLSDNSLQGDNSSSVPASHWSLTSKTLDIGSVSEPVRFLKAPILVFVEKC